jgi:hypothetical protein
VKSVLTGTLGLVASTSVALMTGSPEASIAAALGAGALTFAGGVLGSLFANESERKRKPVADLLRNHTLAVLCARAFRGALARIQQDGVSNRAYGVTIAIGDLCRSFTDEELAGILFPDAAPDDAQGRSTTPQLTDIVGFLQQLGERAQTVQPREPAARTQGDSDSPRVEPFGIGPAHEITAWEDAIARVQQHLEHPLPLLPPPHELAREVSRYYWPLVVALLKEDGGPGHLLGGEAFVALQLQVYAALLHEVRSTPALLADLKADLTHFESRLLGEVRSASAALVEQLRDILKGIAELDAELGRAIEDRINFLDELVMNQVEARRCLDRLTANDRYGLDPLPVFEAVYEKQARASLAVMFGLSANHADERIDAILRRYCGRSELQRKLRDFLRSEHTHSLVVHDAPGAGKSRMALAAASEAEKEGYLVLFVTDQRANHQRQLTAWWSQMDEKPKRLLLIWDNSRGDRESLDAFLRIPLEATAVLQDGPTVKTLLTCWRDLGETVRRDLHFEGLDVIGLPSVEPNEDLRELLRTVNRRTERFPLEALIAKAEGSMVLLLVLADALLDDDQDLDDVETPAKALFARHLEFVVRALKADDAEKETSLRDGLLQAAACGRAPETQRTELERRGLVQIGIIPLDSLRINILRAALCPDTHHAKLRLPLSEWADVMKPIVSDKLDEVWLTAHKAVSTCAGVATLDIDAELARVTMESLEDPDASDETFLSACSGAARLSYRLSSKSGYSANLLARALTLAAGREVAPLIASHFAISLLNATAVEPDPAVRQTRADVITELLTKYGTSPQGPEIALLCATTLFNATVGEPEPAICQARADAITELLTRYGTSPQGPEIALARAQALNNAAFGEPDLAVRQARADAITELLTEYGTSPQGPEIAGRGAHALYNATVGEPDPAVGQARADAITELLTRYGTSPQGPEIALWCAKALYNATVVEPNPAVRQARADAITELLTRYGTSPQGPKIALARAEALNNATAVEPDPAVRQARADAITELLTRYGTSPQGPEIAHERATALYNATVVEPDPAVRQARADAITELLTRYGTSPQGPEIALARATALYNATVGEPEPAVRQARADVITELLIKYGTSPKGPEIALTRAKALVNATAVERDKAACQARADAITELLTRYGASPQGPEIAHERATALFNATVGEPEPATCQARADAITELLTRYGTSPQGPEIAHARAKALYNATVGEPDRELRKLRVEAIGELAREYGSSPHGAVLKQIHARALTNLETLDE